MTDDDPGHCAICKISFLDTDETDEEEGILTCSSCYQISHISCAESHACPCQAASDQAKLRAWEKACADA
jgi:hypothetical protein